mgnify:FL=1|tara:strand:- start:72 stop:755 length:684 start_codon:yes stop_codon:yes gene_type:complete
MSIKDTYKVQPIKPSETHEWLLYKHYAKRLPSISYAFGLYQDKILIGICTFGSPPSNALCIGVCGEENRDKVMELNRLCLNDHKVKNLTSYFLSNCLKLLPNNKIIVSYADTSQNHHGYIYQATNWLYTGLSVKRTDAKIIGEEDNNKHSRHLFDKYGTINQTKEHYPDKITWVDRPQKHRYVIFTGSKKEKKILKKALNYKIQPYPKGDNKKYDASYKPSTQITMF